MQSRRVASGGAHRVRVTRELAARLTWSRDARERVAARPLQRHVIVRRVSRARLRTRSSPSCPPEPFPQNIYIERHLRSLSMGDGTLHSLNFTETNQTTQLEVLRRESYTQSIRRLTASSWLIASCLACPNLPKQLTDIETLCHHSDQRLGKGCPTRYALRKHGEVSCTW